MSLVQVNVGSNFIFFAQQYDNDHHNSSQTWLMTNFFTVTELAGVKDALK